MSSTVVLLSDSDSDDEAKWRGRPKSRYESYTRLIQDVDVVYERLLHWKPPIHVKKENIFEELEVRRLNQFRIQEVVQLFTNFRHFYDRVDPTASTSGITTKIPEKKKNEEPKVSNNDTPVENENYVELLIDAESVLAVLPNVDFEEVCVRLRTKVSVPNRASVVIDEIMAGNDHNVVSANGSKRSIDAIHSDISPKKIRPDEEAGPSGMSNIGLDLTKVVIDSEIEADNEDQNENEEQNEKENEQFQTKLQTLKETFPNADPDHLTQVLFDYGNVQACLEAKVLSMLEKGDYPKLKDRQQREKMELMKQTYMTRVYDPEEVLLWFEDPIAYFKDIDRVISTSYRQHANIQTYNDWPKLTCTAINHALHRNKFHYVPTNKELKKLDEREKNTPRYKNRKKRQPTELPAIPDEVFYKELAFSRVQKELKNYLKNKEIARAEKVAQAIKDRSFLVCQCCYDDQLLMDETVDCGNGHCFCRLCVQRGAEVAAGQGLCQLNCMVGGCDLNFSLSILQSVLKPSIFSNWLIRLQTEEVTKANIPDLVQCPHCSFAAIMPDPEDKVFRCLNAECLKETCRLCKEPNHIPLRCDELEKANEVKMRTFIENKMTEALVRVCPKCNRRFMKEIGCNMMKCVCGQSMCYVCRQPIKDYSHFGRNSCPHDVNTAELHMKEVAEGGLRAKQEFVEQNPEYSNVNLKFDPTQKIEQPTVKGKGKERLHYVNADPQGQNWVQNAPARNPIADALNGLPYAQYYRVGQRDMYLNPPIMTRAPQNPYQVQRNVGFRIPEQVPNPQNNQGPGVEDPTIRDPNLFF